MRECDILDQTLATEGDLTSEGDEERIMEIIPLRGGLAELLGSEVAGFYERAGLCCDD